MEDVTSEDVKELNEIENQLFTAFNNLKRFVRLKNESLYERWKAGGFLVDNNIVSMYPNAEEVLEALREDVVDEVDMIDEEY